MWGLCLAWTGGNDRNTEGLYVSSRGAEVTFTNWHSNEPNRHDAYDDCIVLTYPNGKWADFGCNDKRPYVCEKWLLR
jgi:hypothetical protein